MKRLATRLWINVGITMVIAIAIFLAWWLSLATLIETTFISGWTLASLFILLAAYNVRKLLTFLPLGSSSLWLQIHLYAGWLTLALFAVHIGFRVPNGWLESILAVIYLAVAGTGIVGILLSRTAAPRLTRRGESVLYERIPLHYKQVREQAEELVLQTVTQSNAPTIADFYSSTLIRFFHGPCNTLAHLVGVSRHRHRLLHELNALERYLNATERDFLAQIVRLVEIKDDLDFQFATQRSLKCWLFVHIPLTYALLIVTAAHVLTVYTFIGSAW
ncbi:MAG: hypothetical protein IH984_04580 [Planctomycetes bacterium]|nr:hypothetical protein [Planctomycetota bacterium]